MWKEAPQRRKQFKQFGRLLVTRHGQNHQAIRNGNTPIVDDVAVNFGRYLRAARVNADMQLEELAHKSRLPHGTLLALEQGLILNNDIKPKWVNRLANALDEDVDYFNLLLKRSLEQKQSRWNRLVQQVQIPRINLAAKPLYAALPALLLCVVFAAVLLPKNSTAPSAPAPTAYNQPDTIIHIDSEARLNMIKAERRLNSEIYYRGNTVQLPALDGNRLNIVKAEYAFQNEILHVPTYLSASTFDGFDAEGRPNLVKAETNFESQMILITRFINLNLPTFVDVNPEERLNMVKAETRLENEILVFHRGFQPLDIDYPKVEYNGNLQFSHRFGGI